MGVRPPTIPLTAQRLRPAVPWQPTTMLRLIHSLGFGGGQTSNIDASPLYWNNTYSIFSQLTWVHVTPSRIYTVPQRDEQPSRAVRTAARVRGSAMRSHWGRIDRVPTAFAPCFHDANQLQRQTYIYTYGIHDITTQDQGPQGDSLRKQDSLSLDCTVWPSSQSCHQ